MMTKLIPCPRCRKMTVYGPENLFRPFCSHRCKLFDTADWADGQNKIPGEPAHVNSEEDLSSIEEE